MNTVLNHVAKKERFHLPADAATSIIKESNGNMRKALLVFEALKMQRWVHPAGKANETLPRNPILIYLLLLYVRSAPISLPISRLLNQIGKRIVLKLLISYYKNNLRSAYLKWGRRYMNCYRIASRQLSSSRWGKATVWEEKASLNWSLTFCCACFFVSADHHGEISGEDRWWDEATDHTLGCALCETGGTFNSLDVQTRAYRRCFQELRMQQGSKKIYHLEAYFAKVMSIYKNYTLLGMEDFEMWGRVKSM